MLHAHDADAVEHIVTNDYINTTASDPGLRGKVRVEGGRRDGAEWCGGPGPYGVSGSETGRTWCRCPRLPSPIVGRGVCSTVVRRLKAQRAAPTRQKRGWGE